MKTYTDDKQTEGCALEQYRSHIAIKIPKRRTRMYVEEERIGFENVWRFEGCGWSEVWE